jgi:hypothetical protein
MASTGGHMLVAMEDAARCDEHKHGDGLCGRLDIGLGRGMGFYVVGVESAAVGCEKGSEADEGF